MRAVAASVMGKVVSSYRIMAQDVVPGDTIAVCSTFSLAARLLRDTHAVPCAVLHLAPSVLRSEYCAPRFSPLGHMTALPRFIKRFIWRTLDKKFMDPLYTAPFNAIRAELGLPPIRRMFHDWLHAADATLCMTPDWFAARQPDWPAQVAMTGFPFVDSTASVPLDSALSQFLDDGAAPVVITAGTANAVSHAFFSAAIGACSKLGLRAIAVTADASQLPAILPVGVIHAAHAPFATLLPRAAAFIHHVGIGSVSQALRAGVPQLIQPMAFDQFDNASRVVQLGAGREILPRHFQVDRVAPALENLLGDAAVRANCQRVAGVLLEEDGIARACAHVMTQLRPQLTTQLKTQLTAAPSALPV